MPAPEPTPTRLQSGLLWFATISVPIGIAAVILAALAYGLWVLSHFNIQ
jgi:hypothetical protein